MGMCLITNLKEVLGGGEEVVKWKMKPWVSRETRCMCKIVLKKNICKCSNRIFHQIFLVMNPLMIGVHLMLMPCFIGVSTAY